MITKSKKSLAIIKHKIYKVFSSHHEPDYLARSAAIGIFIALTPTFGFQIIMVIVIWLITEFFKSWRFNMAIGIAVTWLTNYFTIIPYYFLSYFTGLWITSNIFGFDPVVNYGRFSMQWQKALEADLVNFFLEFVKIMYRIGKPLLLGSLIYALIGSVAVYHLTLYAVRRHREKKEQHNKIEC